jgi:glycosyltransferase involved in cell wall biosynthesis
MKICFWGGMAYALTGKTDGGGELQMALMAKALARSGHEVVVIDYKTREDFVTQEGIKVYKIKGWNNGLRMLRTITHRIPELYRSLKRQKADIYYCRIRDFRHILAYWAARKSKAKFVLHMASDLDAMSFKKRWKNFYLTKSAGLWWFFSGLLVEIVYPFLLRHADLVLVQHEGQKKILEKKNIKSVVLLNIIDLAGLPDPKNPERKDFAYVGWLDKRKGFVEFFELVNKAPGHTYKVIGPPRDQTGLYYFNKLKSYPNVALLGELKHSDTVREIANSKALISTSPMEGFPNVFIEAWACGIPVISLKVDPGSVIEKQGLGEVAKGDLDRMVTALDNVRYDSEFSEKAKNYVENNHAFNANRLYQINRLFNELKNGNTK